MLVIDNNQNGRILVRDFEVTKIVYLFFKEFYPQLRVYAVQYINNNLNVYLHDNEYISASLLENIQNEFKKHFQTKMGIYLKNINFIFKYE